MRRSVELFKNEEILAEEGRMRTWMSGQPAEWPEFFTPRALPPTSGKRPRPTSLSVLADPDHKEFFVHVRIAGTAGDPQAVVADGNGPTPGMSGNHTECFCNRILVRIEHGDETTA